MSNDGEDAREEGEVLLKLKHLMRRVSKQGKKIHAAEAKALRLYSDVKHLKRRLIKHEKKIRAAEAKALRLNSEATQDGAGVFEAAAQESKRFEKARAK